MIPENGYTCLHGMALFVGCIVYYRVVYSETNN